MFTIFHILVLNTVLDHSQVVLSRRNGDSRINVAQLGTQKHTSRLYPRQKQGQPIPLLSRDLGPRPNLDFKPPHLRPGLSAVLRPPPFPRLQSVGPERAETHDKRVMSLPAPISKYVLRIINLLPDYHPQQRTVLN
jgi:hypothetical protein